MMLMWRTAFWASPTSPRRRPARSFCVSLSLSLSLSVSLFIFISLSACLYLPVSVSPSPSTPSPPLSFLCLPLSQSPPVSRSPVNH